MSDRIINTSGKDLWGTPPEVLAWIRHRFGVISLDAAAIASNAVAPKHLGPGGLIEDSLSGEPWPSFDGVTFVNPPYSRAAGGLERWCEAMSSNSRNGIVVGLFFARTESKAWHDHVSKADQVYFVKRRLKFIDPETGEVKGWAPAPSVVVVWAPGFDGPPCYRNLDLSPYKLKALAEATP